MATLSSYAATVSRRLTTVSGFYSPRQPCHPLLTCRRWSAVCRYLSQQARPLQEDTARILVRQQQMQSPSFFHHRVWRSMSSYPTDQSSTPEEKEKEKQPPSIEEFYALFAHKEKLSIAESYDEENEENRDEENDSDEDEVDKYFEEQEELDSTSHLQSESDESSNNSNMEGIRLSKLISIHAQNFAYSRNEAERLIRTGQVTLAGKVVTSPAMVVDPKHAVGGHLQVKGKAFVMLQASGNTNAAAASSSPPSITIPSLRVWLVHKLSGELVSHSDPQGRPTLMERLVRGGVGKSRRSNSKTKQRQHLKPVGRLDMTSEGLMVVTNHGDYARQLELPRNAFHRTYKVRAHGLLTPHKLRRMRQGLVVKGVRYRGMKVKPIERSVRVAVARRDRGNPNILANVKPPSNKWLEITCTEGKNRVIRNVLEHLGLTVTRLIRVSYGDYELGDIPPGMAIEVTPIALDDHKRRGSLLQRRTKKPKQPSSLLPEEAEASPIRWVRYT